MGTSRFCLALTLCVAALACESGNTSHVVLNLAALRSQALSVAATQVDSVSVQVTARDIRTPLTFTFDVTLLTASFDVPAGPARIYTVTAYSNASTPPVPTYWGQVQSDAPPDATTSMTLPAFPAGVLKGQLLLSDDTPVPQTVNLLLTAVDGRANAPDSVPLVAASGQFQQALPTGTWEISGSVVVNGNTYSASPPVSVNISQGQVTNANVVLMEAAGSNGLALVFVEQPAQTVAGAPFAVSVGIYDHGLVQANLSATITLSLVGATSQLNGTTTVTTDNGVARFQGLSVSVAQSGYFLVASATDYTPTTSNPFDVMPGPLAQLAFEQFPHNLFTTQTVPVVIAGADALANPVPTYSGTITFSSSDNSATLPGVYSFAPRDNGVHTFSPGIHMATVGNQTISVHDDQGLSATMFVTVAAPPSVVNLGVAGATNGQAGANQNVVVSALYGGSNVYTGYLGTVSLTVSDPNAQNMPSTYNFSPSDLGVHTFTGIRLVSVGTFTFTATDTHASAGTGHQTVTITAGNANHFALGWSLTSPVTGVSDTLTLTVQDAYGNTSVQYAGAVTFTSTDTAATLPPNYTFVPATDNGTHGFSVMFGTTGTQSVTVTDTNNTTITGNANVTVL